MTFLKRLKWYLFGIPGVDNATVHRYAKEEEFEAVLQRGHKWKVGLYAAYTYAQYRAEGLSPEIAFEESLLDWDLK